jgi:hypothetical protein
VRAAPAMPPKMMFHASADMSPFFTRYNRTPQA